MDRRCGLSAVMLARALSVALLSVPALAAEDPTALVAEAAAAHPSLQALEASERALRERAEVAGSWGDPVVALEYSNAPISSLSISDHPMAGLQLRAQQPLRPPGWSGAAREAAGAAAEAAALDRAEAALALEVAVRRGWWSLVRVRLMAALTEEHLAQVALLEDAVRIRYETGAVGQSAALRVAVLRGRLSEELADLGRAEAELVAALGAATARGQGARFDTPDAVRPLPPPAERDWAALVAAERPALAALEVRAGGAESAAELARLEALPDPSIWVGYRLRTVQTETDPGVDMISVGLGVPLPTGSARRAGGERAASLEQASAHRAAREASLDRAEAEVAAALARWSRAAEKAEAYEQSLLPDASAALESALAEFSVGEADFQALIDARVTLIDLERAQLDAAVETHLQWAAVLGAVGVSPGGGQ